MDPSFCKTFAAASNHFSYRMLNTPLFSIKASGCAASCFAVTNVCVGESVIGVYLRVYCYDVYVRVKCVCICVSLCERVCVSACVYVCMCMRMLQRLLYADSRSTKLVPNIC